MATTLDQSNSKVRFEENFYRSNDENNQLAIQLLHENLKFKSLIALVRYRDYQNKKVENLKKARVFRFRYLIETSFQKLEKYQREKFISQRNIKLAEYHR